VWVISDEIYEHLVYGDNVFSSILALVPELADRCIIANGVAKTYAMTGWRVGWLIGPRDVVAAATALQSHSTSHVPNVSQAAALAAVTGDLRAVEDMREAFDRRRRTMVKLLNDIPGIVCPEPGGAFYCFPSVVGALGRDIAGRRVNSSLELASVILDRARVAVVPGEGFGAPGHLRLSYALDDGELVDGLSRIGDLLS
jgi:aspartate/methionine/tyrosine aminotransferase